MISHVHSTTIPVADQDAALDFYVNTLGWERGLDTSVEEGMRFLTVVPPGGQTHLVLAHESWAGGETVSVTAGGNTGITLVSPDIDATYETLRARGVMFKEPVTATPWGTKSTWFSDLDGNVFFLVDE